MKAMHYKLKALAALMLAGMMLLCGCDSGTETMPVMEHLKILK